MFRILISYSSMRKADFVLRAPVKVYKAGLLSRVHPLLKRHTANISEWVSFFNCRRGDCPRHLLQVNGQRRELSQQHALVQVWLWTEMHRKVLLYLPIQFFWQQTSAALTR